VRPRILLALPLCALGVWLWTSTAQPPPHASIPATAVFTPEQIARARDFREPGYLLAVALILTQITVAWVLAGIAPSRVAHRPAELVAAAVAATVAAVAIPFSYVDHVRGHDVGLDTRSFGQWAGDAILGLLLWTVAITIAYLAGRLAWKRVGDLGFAGAAWLLVALVTLVQPLVVDPLIVSTRPAPPFLATEAAALERRMDAHPASLTVSDAASRTTAENAFVDGLGPTVRVVVDNTTLREPRPVQRALLAHELAHVAEDHTLEGVLWFGVVGVPAILLVLAAAARLCRGMPGGLASAGAVPVLVALALTAQTVLLPVQNLLSRRIEAEADWVALQTTRDPGGAELLQKRLALTNLSNPEPPRWVVLLLFDHPPVMDRIAVDLAYSSSSSSSRSR
jgi:STE24 endopeptidase